MKGIKMSINLLAVITRRETEFRSLGVVGLGSEVYGLGASTLLHPSVLHTIAAALTWAPNIPLTSTLNEAEDIRGNLRKSLFMI